MALLTAEDVLNKAFSKTKYREGFDQDEVDDFLDEVANTIAQLTAERDEFAARLAAGGGAAAAPAAPAAEAPAVTSAGGVPGTTGLLAAATEPGGASPTGMLAMAQKLHDEYVQAGEAERDRIVDQANAAADQIRERADLDAKARMDDLAGERAGLEARIDDLRRFERDYRARLKAYLENLLGDLDHTATGAAAGVAAAGLADLPGGEEVAPAGEATAGYAEEAVPDLIVVEEVVDVYEGEDGAVVVEDYVEATAVSFDEAVRGFEPEAEVPAVEPEAPAADPFAQPAVEDAFQPPAPPTYDATQSWESQLRPPSGDSFANPFAPVSGVTAEGATEGDGAAEVPEVAEATESEEAPYTPPSSRMFSDLYGQQRPEDEN